MDSDKGVKRVDSSRVSLITTLASSAECLRRSVRKMDTEKLLLLESAATDLMVRAYNGRGCIHVVLDCCTTLHSAEDGTQLEAVVCSCLAFFLALPPHPLPLYHTLTLPSLPLSLSPSLRSVTIAQVMYVCIYCMWEGRKEEREGETESILVLQSPPYAVTQEKRREAEAIFMDLKKSKLPYDACKFILGTVGIYITLREHTLHAAHYTVSYTFCQGQSCPLSLEDGLSSLPPFLLEFTLSFPFSTLPFHSLSHSLSTSILPLSPAYLSPSLPPSSLSCFSPSLPPFFHLSPASLPSFLLLASLPPFSLPPLLRSLPLSTLPSLPVSYPPSLHPTLPPSILPSLSPPYPPCILPSLPPPYPPSLHPTLPPSTLPSLPPSYPPSLHPTLPPCILPSLSPPYPPSHPEHSGSDYVLFQAGSTMREAVIREWRVLTGDERDALRGYILHYITTKPESVITERGRKREGEE